MTDDEVDVLARHLVAMAELDDATQTATIELLVSRTDGALVGLDHRIKTVDSLRRKLTDLLALDPDLDLNEAADRIYDVLRFTIVADEAAYMAVHERLLADLQRHGVTIVAVRNRWPGPGYRGINVHLRVGVDQRFEIQFHTRASYAAAKATRGQYEELRLANTSPARAAELAAAIDEAFARVPRRRERYPDARDDRVLCLQPRRARPSRPRPIRHRQARPPLRAVRSTGGPMDPRRARRRLPQRVRRLG